MRKVYRYFRRKNYFSHKRHVKKKKPWNIKFFYAPINRVRHGLVHFSLGGHFRVANMIALKDYYHRWREILRVDLKTAFFAIKKVINNYEDRIRGTSAGF